MKSHYDLYKSAEAASYMTGLITFIINNLENRDRKLATYINRSLIECFEKYSWGDHTDRWLNDFILKQEQLTQKSNETI